MSDTSKALSRQWIPLPGGSCDVRMGTDALERAAKVLKTSVARPRRCMAVVSDTVGDELRERLRRQLVDAGFEVVWYQTRPGGARTLEAASAFARACATAEVTADDLCCAVGGSDVLSMASFVCGTWCGGMSLMAVPVDEVAFLEGALGPQALDVGGATRRVEVRPFAKHVLLDYGLAVSDMDSEAARYTRTLMVAAAVCGSEREFSSLWDRAPALMGDDIDTYIKQLLATAKARGQIMSSTAAAVRNSLDYGKVFAFALRRLSGYREPMSALLAEGMRFSARISVMLGKLTLDDMLAQDELLDALGIGTVTCDVDPEDLLFELKGERFERSNRFMLPCPVALGRVRLTTVEDELLGEHASAWCAAHRA